MKRWRNIYKLTEFLFNFIYLCKFDISVFITFSVLEPEYIKILNILQTLDTSYN